MGTVLIYWVGCVTNLASSKQNHHQMFLLGIKDSRSSHIRLHEKDLCISTHNKLYWRNVFTFFIGFHMNNFYNRPTNKTHLTYTETNNKVPNSNKVQTWMKCIELQKVQCVPGKARDLSRLLLLWLSALLITVCCIIMAHLVYHNFKHTTLTINCISSVWSDGIFFPHDTIQSNTIDQN